MTNSQSTALDIIKEFEKFIINIKPFGINVSIQTIILAIVIIILIIRLLRNMSD